MASTERVFHVPGSALYSPFLPHFRTQTLSLRGLNLACRSFSAQAVQVSESRNETRVSKKGRNPSSSWEEAGELFFSSKNGKNEKGDDGGEKNIISVRESVQSRSSRSPVEEEPADKGRSSNMSNKFERNKGRSTDVFDDGKLRNGQRGYGRGRTDDGGFPYRGNARNDADDRGPYRSNGRSGGFREQFSDTGVGRTTYGSNARSGGFREEFSNGVSGRDTYRSKENDGGFRKQFSDSNDRPRGAFHNKNRGGSFGKKQFPDLDGGKRLFKGRFQGDGFVRKQTRDIEDAEDNSRKGSYGASKRALSGSRVGKQIQDEEESYASSGDDDDESEDVPEAGDVIRYSEIANAKPRRQAHGVMNDHGELQEDEDEEEADEDEDESAYRRKGFGAGRRELPAMGSSLPRIKGEVVYGVGPVYAALQISRREFFCLYIQENMPISGGNASKKKDKKALEWIIRSAIDRGLEVKEISKHDLNMLADKRPHQGLILDASPLQLVVSSELDVPFTENGKAPVWVALDEVTDPQNFGAILRSAYFLGAAGVIVCAKNSAPLSAVVSKASAGALEVMELRSCKNMMKFLDKSTENGWRVVGGSAAGADVTPVSELPRGLPTILVLGGEGKGLRTNVKRSCSELVCIPGLASESPAKQGSVVSRSKQEEDAVGVNAEGNKARNFLKGAREDFIAVESLNVSVAAGILLHELLNSQSAAECSTPPEAELSDECLTPLEAVVSDEYLTAV